MAKAKRVTKAQAKRVMILKRFADMESFEEFESVVAAKKSRRLCRQLMVELSTISQQPSYARNWIDQVLRSADSVYANLAEGYGCGSNKRIYFIRIARGSAFETLAHLQVAPVKVSDEFASGYRKLCKLLTEEIKECCNLGIRGILEPSLDE